jgi:sec-independent protein translocase protein TatB
MPQIGWFEILIEVVLSILIIGPKDFPIVLKKIGGWESSIKRYFSEIQKDMTDMENVVEDEISLEKDYSNQTSDKKKDE